MYKLHKIILWNAALLALTTALPATVTETIRQTYPMSARGTVSLDNINGEVEIVAWDKAEVSLEAIKSAPDEEGLKRIQVVVEAQPASLATRSVHDKVRLGVFWIGSVDAPGDVHYKLMVPVGTTLLKVSTVNSNILCTGVRGDIEIHSDRGSIRLVVSKEASFDLVAYSEKGSVACALPIKIEEAGIHRLRGRIGQGGAKVKINTVKGSVQIAQGF